MESKGVPKEVKRDSVELVLLDSLVAMKIIKHCKENLPDLVTGQLLGLAVGNTLEITNCFPFPSKIEDEENPEETSLGGAEYQLEMMKHLTDVNADSNTVGWYSSTYMGSFVNDSTVATQFNYQDSRSIKQSVMLLYDPVRTSQGVLALQAYRLTPAFMELYRNQQFTKEGLAKAGLSNSFEDVYQEIPIRLHTSSLASAFLYDLDEKYHITSDYERLDLASNTFLERNLEFMIECLEDLSVEQNKFQFYQRQLLKQQQQQTQWLQKRRNDNAIRKANGEALLPEEDPSNPVFKSPPEPSRLDSLLITNQINYYCRQINQFTGNSFSKLFMVGGLQQKE